MTVIQMSFSVAVRHIVCIETQTERNKLSSCFKCLGFKLDLLYNIEIPIGQLCEIVIMCCQINERCGDLTDFRKRRIGRCVRHRRFAIISLTENETHKIDRFDLFTFTHLAKRFLEKFAAHRFAPFRYQMLAKWPGQLKSFLWICAAIQFVDDHQTIGGYILQNVFGHIHFQHKRWCVLFDRIIWTDSSENSVSHSQRSTLCRYVAAQLRIRKAEIHKSLIRHATSSEW